MFVVSHVCPVCMSSGVEGCFVVHLLMFFVMVCNALLATMMMVVKCFNSKWTQTIT